MPKLLAILLSLTAALTAWGQDDTHRAQINAATANAVEALRQEVYKLPLGSAITVRDLIERTGAQDDLLHTLQRSQQIGGPRWLDENTCQVRLEISGAPIAHTLLQVATVAHERTPISAQALQPRLEDVSRRTFTATGTSMGARAAETICPAPGDAAWSSIPRESRRAAIRAAHQNAIGRILDSLRPIELAPGRTLASLFDAPDSPLKRQLQDYFERCPVNSVRFRDDMQVEVALAAAAPEVADVIQSALREVPIADPTAFRDRMIKQMASPVGTAPAAGPAASASAIRLPSLAPEWVGRQIDAQGSAKVPGNKLQSRWAAEADAARKLRTQTEALPLAPQLTLGEAARKDERIADALARGLAHARPSKADYDADGSVTVWLSLELSDLWGELRSIP